MFAEFEQLLLNIAPPLSALLSRLLSAHQAIAASCERMHPHQRPFALVFTSSLNKHLQLSDLLLPQSFVHFA
jgi:hypothetical protein